MEFEGLIFKVNPLFLLILFLFIIIGFFIEAAAAFLLVFLHECVHLFAAWKLGFTARKIEIFPYGGMAEYNGLLELEPFKEAVVAVSGPLFNIFLAVILIILSKFGINFFRMDLLIKYNFIIAAINLIPALPLDGGRILRALLVHSYGFKKGNNAAVYLARVIAFCGIILGIIILIFNFSNLYIIIFSFFIYSAVNREKKQISFYLLRWLTKRRRTLKEVDIKNTKLRIIKENMTAREAVSYINPSYYNLFFVLGEKLEYKGLITETQLIDSFFSNKSGNYNIYDILDKE